MVIMSELVLDFPLQDACIQLELNDATLLLPTLVKTTKVLEALPKLEQFAAQVRDGTGDHCSSLATIACSWVQIDSLWRAGNHLLFNCSRHCPSA